MIVSYEATPLGKPSPEGLEAVELFPRNPAAFPGLKPPYHQRNLVSVITPAGTYRGAIRTYPTDGKYKDSVYLCPDLISDKDNRKISLAKMLSEIGVKARDTVNVDIDGSTWRINLSGYMVGETAANQMNSKAPNQYTVRCNGEVVLENAAWSAAEKAARAVMVAKGCSRSEIKVVGTYVGRDKDFIDYVGKELDWMTLPPAKRISTPKPTVELLQHGLSLLQGKAALTELYNYASKNLQKGILPTGKVFAENSDDEAGESVDAVQGGLPT